MADKIVVEAAPRESRGKNEARRRLSAIGSQATAEDRALSQMPCRLVEPLFPAWHGTGLCTRRNLG